MQKNKAGSHKNCTNSKNLPNVSHPLDNIQIMLLSITLYSKCILLRLISGFVNPRRYSPRRSRCKQHFRGLTNPDDKLKRMHQLFCYMTIFSCLAAVTKVMLTGLGPEPGYLLKNYF